MVIATLAVLKAGKTYLAIHPAMPATRQAEIVRDVTPELIVTTAAFAPPEGIEQLEIVNYFLSRLRPDWSPEVERSLAGAAGTTTERSYRVTFSRADHCLILGTAGMVADLAQPVYTLSAYGREGASC